MKRMSVFPRFLASLSLAVFFLAAESHAIEVEPFGPWTLKLNGKDITPASEFPGPPDGAGRAHLQRAFGGDPDTGKVGTVVDQKNFTADPLKIKAYAKVTNDSSETDGVSAMTSLEFWRMYKTTPVRPSGYFSVKVKGAVDGIKGTLKTHNPFFRPMAYMNLAILVYEVDATGVPIGPPGRNPDAIAPAVEVGQLVRWVPQVGRSAWGGDPASPGTRTVDIESDFEGGIRTRKGRRETKYFMVTGSLTVGASIQAVDPLHTRKAYCDRFRKFLNALKRDPKADPPWYVLEERASALIDLKTGELTPAGMSGYAEANFFSTVDLTVEAEDIAPDWGIPYAWGREPPTWDPPRWDQPSWDPRDWDLFPGFRNSGNTGDSSSTDGFDLLFGNEW